MWLRLSARTLTPLFDLRQQPRGCVSDSDELVCNRLLLTEEFGRLSLCRSQPGAQLLGRTHEFFFNFGYWRALRFLLVPDILRIGPCKPASLVVHRTLWIVIV